MKAIQRKHFSGCFFTWQENNKERWTARGKNVGIKYFGRLGSFWKNSKSKTFHKLNICLNSLILYQSRRGNYFLQYFEILLWFFVKHPPQCSGQCSFLKHFLVPSCSHRWIQVAMVTHLFSPHSALCAHGWPRRLPVWRKKWLDCCRSWSATPGATCRAGAQSRASLTGWPRCPSARREVRGPAKRLWGKCDNTYQRESITTILILQSSDSTSLLYSSRAPSLQVSPPSSVPPVSRGRSQEGAAHPRHPGPAGGLSVAVLDFP